jgi:predicted dehydrogenase
VSGRAALVGCGRIAGDHLTALRAAGATVESVTATAGSSRAPTFARDHDVATVHHDVGALARDPGWDVAVVAVPPEETVSVVAALAESGRPLLVEKPGALDPQELERLGPHAAQLLFGYNRRFYAPVAAAAELLAERGPAVIELVLPDRVPGSPDDDPRERQFLANSTHGLDLLLHLVGPVELRDVRAIPGDGGPGALVASATSERGDLVQLTAAWNAPDNFRCTCSWSGLRYELRPFEVGTRYEGMEVLEPTPDHPVRRYVARATAEHFATSPGTKPGFLEQARALLALAAGEPTPTGATLADAVAALRLGRDLLDRAGGPAAS